MIALITGIVAAKKPTYVVVDTNGVGYRVFVSLSTFYTLPTEGEKVTLHIHTHVREEAIHLYGFATEGERGVFEKLIGVSKVGPKLAITILSGLDHIRFAEAIRNQDKARLATIPGVGKKTAERLVLEMADKLGDVEGLSPAGGSSGGSSHPPKARDEAIEALVSLGYKRAEAEKGVDNVSDPSLPLEALLKKALASLAR